MLKVASLTLEIVALGVAVWLLLSHPSGGGSAMWSAVTPPPGPASAGQAAPGL